MKNWRGAEKRRCQQKKTLDEPRELCDCRCRWYSVHIVFLLSRPTGMPLVLSPHWDSFLSRPTGTPWFIWVAWCVGSALVSILLQVGGVVVVLAPEDTVAAAAAYRVEVTVPVVGLLAEAGVGVLAAGAAIATSPSSHLGVLGLGSREGGGHAIFSYGAWVYCWFGPLSTVGVRKNCSWRWSGRCGSSDFPFPPVEGGACRCQQCPFSMRRIVPGVPRNMTNAVIA